MLELYHWEPNTYSLKPLIALREKRVEFVSRYFDPTRFEQFAPDFPRNRETDLHLDREGPVLVHDGAIISSSFFMLEYISEALPGSSLSPGGALEQYRRQAWGQIIALQVAPAVNALGCAQYLCRDLHSKHGPAALRARIGCIEPQERRAIWADAVSGAQDATALAALRARLLPLMQRLESALSESPWLTGADYSIADIDAFSMIHTLPQLAPDIVNGSTAPRVLDFIGRMHERAAVRDALAMSRTGKPQEAFVPGAEASRWG
jgi:glutathione S-transferase